MQAAACIMHKLALADRKARFDGDSEIESEEVEQPSPVVTLFEQLKSPTVAI
jgi:hypothetical protein